jgi:hypothetical protein
MECDGHGEKIGAFFEGALEGEAADEVLEHVERCPACRARLEALESVGAPLRVEPPAVAAVEWSARWTTIEAAIGAGGRRAGAGSGVDEVAAARTARLVRFLIPLAAAALISMGAYLYALVAEHDAGVDTDDPFSHQVALIETGGE